MPGSVPYFVMYQWQQECDAYISYLKVLPHHTQRQPGVTITAIAVLVLIGPLTEHRIQVKIITVNEAIVIGPKEPGVQWEQGAPVAISSYKCGFTRSFLTRSAVLQGHQGYKVLAVVAENDGVSVAFLGRPVERQVNPAHLQRSEIGTRFQTSQHFVCVGKEREINKARW